MPGMTPERKDEIERRLKTLEVFATRPDDGGAVLVPTRKDLVALKALIGTDVPALLAEVEQLTAEVEPFQILTHQACPKKEHAAWFIDSEYNHLCPWCRIAELEATPADWDAQRRRADELEAEVEQLAEAARNALASLDMFIQDHPDPGTQALGDRHVLAQALSKLPATDGGETP